jgi:hypothetical protein
MLLVMVTCQAPVLMLKGARFAAATMVAVNTATTNTNLLCIGVSCLRLLLEAQWREQLTAIAAVRSAPPVGRNIYHHRGARKSGRNIILRAANG